MVDYREGLVTGLAGSLAARIRILYPAYDTAEIARLLGVPESVVYNEVFGKKWTNSKRIALLKQLGARRWSFNRQKGNIA